MPRKRQPTKPKTTSDVVRARFARSPREEQRMRIAWFYYVEGLTQTEVSERVGLSRPLVNQILASCRAEGLIQVRVNSNLRSCAEAAQRLIERFSLLDAVVMPSPAHEEHLAQTIGLQAGYYLSDRLKSGLHVGIGWGQTLWHSLQGIPRQNLRDLSIVSMIGGLTRYSEISPYETATRLADILAAHCYYMAAPIYASDPSARDVLLEQPTMGEIFEHVRACDIALISAGQLDDQATLIRLGLINEGDMAALRRLGAVGDLLGHYLDEDGNVLDCPVNARLIAAHPADLRHISRVVLASGGQSKTGALKAILRARYANVLITDEKTADLLCE